MDGTASASAAGNVTSVGTGAYTFYLNIVILSAPPPDHTGAPSTPSKTERKDPAKAHAERQEANLAPAAAHDDEGPTHPSQPPSQAGESSSTSNHALVPKGKDLFGSLGTMTGSVSQSFSKLKLADRMSSGITSVDKSLTSAARAVSKKTASVASNVSDKTATYVANRTMASRASAALGKALPEVVRAMTEGSVHHYGEDVEDDDEAMERGGGRSRRNSSGSGLDMTVSYVFRRESVIVLQVDLRSTCLSSYVAEVRGEDAAEHYRCAASSLKLLGATETMGQLEKEMLPLVRRGLMEKMSKDLIRVMKNKDGSGAPLEVECVALEEGEEARWLFTFMEFQSQMK